MTYLITGATGDIGSRVVENLINQGERPRVFVRDPNKAYDQFGDRVDIYIGNLANKVSLMSALDDVDVLFLVSTGQDIPKLDKIAAEAAQSTNVRHLVKLSSIDARQGYGTGVWHALGEAAIRESGIGHTFVQPSGFMSNALGWADSIKSQGSVRSCTGNGKIAFIHPDDVAAVVTQVLAPKNYFGEMLPITGPETLSYEEMVSKIGNAIGRLLKFVPITREEARQQMVKGGAKLTDIEAHLSLWDAIREGHATIVTNEVQKVLRRAPMAFDQWAAENAGAFR